MECQLFSMKALMRKKRLIDIKTKQVTIMSVVGTMLTRMVDTLKNSRLPVHFRCFLLGGGPAPLPLLEACLAKNLPVFQSYGMTETSSQIVTLAPEYSRTKLVPQVSHCFHRSLRSFWKMEKLHRQMWQVKLS